MIKSHSLSISILTYLFPFSALSHYEIFNGSFDLSSTTEIYRLFRSLGIAYSHLCQYRCEEAIAAFSDIEQNQRRTGWVLCAIGKAYLEMCKYPMVKKRKIVFFFSI